MRLFGRLSFWAAKGKNIGEEALGKNRARAGRTIQTHLSDLFPPPFSGVCFPNVHIPTAGAPLSLCLWCAWTQRHNFLPRATSQSDNPPPRISERSLSPLSQSALPLHSPFSYSDIRSLFQLPGLGNCFFLEHFYSPLDAVSFAPQLRTCRFLPQASSDVALALTKQLATLLHVQGH